MPRPSPKKYLPRGIRVLFEDSALLIIDKPVGLLSVPARYEPEENALSLMTNWLRKGQAKSRKQLFAVNRLDRETSGILVFAKSLDLRERMHEHWDENEKIYRAVVAGTPEPAAGTLKSWLVQDENYVVHNLPFSENSEISEYSENSKKCVPANPVPATAKFAELSYRVLASAHNRSLVEITLHTGRKNQIRVQFSAFGHPVLGDRVYGVPAKHRLLLHATRFTFTHPITHSRLTIESPCDFKI